MKNIKDELSISGKDKLSDFPEKFNKLVEIVERLVNVVSFLLAVIIAILGQVLLSGKLGRIFDYFNIDWNSLSEAYQILVLGIPVGIVTIVVANFINKKYIDPLIEEDNNEVA